MRLLALGGLVIAPLIAYPLFAVSLLAVDVLAGERLLLYYATFERRAVLETFVADYVAALPAAIIAFSVIASAGFVLVRLVGTRVATLAVAAIAALGAIALAWWLSGVPFAFFHAALALVAALYASVIVLLIALLLSPTQTRMRS